MSSNRPSIHRTFTRCIVLGALFIGASALAPSAQAQSCSNPSTIVHTSYPADGAMAVPTNMPLYVYGPALTVNNSDATLLDESGEEVSIEVQSADGGLLIEAIFGLDPTTTYELTVTLRAGGGEWSGTFTTGTGPATPVELRAPEVTVSVIDRDMGGTCGVVSAICVNGSVPTRMTLEVLVGDEVLSLGGGEPVPAYLANGRQVAANECIDVRVREPGGIVSEPTRVCGAALGRFELAANAAAPQSCQPYRNVPAPTAAADSESSSEDAGGCALGPSGAASGAGGLLLGLAALLVARQRRRAR